MWGLTIRNISGYWLAGIMLADFVAQFYHNKLKELSRTWSSLLCTAGNDDSHTKRKT